MSSREGVRRCQIFYFLFSCSADHERDWPLCKKVVFRVGNQYPGCEKPQLPPSSTPILSWTQHNKLSCIVAYRAFCFCVWCPCKAIDVIVWYNGRAPPRHFTVGSSPYCVGFDGIFIVCYYYRKLVRNVTVHPQLSFLPISDHNIVSAPAKLLGHFARNRRLRVSAKPPVDRRRLVTDPQLQQQVATAVGKHLRANPPGDSNVDDVETAFAAAIMRTPGTKEARTRLEWRRPNGS